MLLRLGIFLLLFVGLASLEHWFPRRLSSSLRQRRWPANIGLAAINQVFMRLILPVSAIALASQLSEGDWGLLGLYKWPIWIELVVGILFLDLAIYLQHRLFHSVPVLWRLHRMHHADTEFDVSTGIRFHPLSVFVSAVIKLAAVALIGPTALAVLVFEILLNATSLFNHSNVALPPKWDAVLRWFVVTPDMHRVHHSSDSSETNTNFGFNFPWWDRMFGSYRPQPALGHIDMQIGLPLFREAQAQSLRSLLLQPFLTEK